MLPLDNERKRCSFHLGGEIVVGTIELGDILSLFRQSGTVEECIPGHMRARLQCRFRLRSLVGITHAIRLGLGRIAKLHIGAQTHCRRDQIRIKLENTVILIALTRHENRFTRLAFFRCPAMTKVIINEPRRPADITYRSA